MGCGDFSGGDKGVVSGGRFQSVAFGPAEGLKPGQYVAEVTMPIPQVQPPQVREVLGTNGENLRGPLVKKGGIGTTVETAAVDFGKCTGVADHTRPRDVRDHVGRSSNRGLISKKRGKALNAVNAVLKGDDTGVGADKRARLDRKSTRLNSSHRSLSRMPSSA